MKALLLLVLVAALVTSGCASYQSQVDRSRPTDGYERFFVQANLNDNHAVAQLIASTLRTRGVEADSGPLTMLPSDAQVVVTYQERWTWDFGEHLVYLRIALRDVATDTPIASAVFNGPVAINKDPPDVVARLIRELLDQRVR
ncbi:hypothetical protein MASR2M8_24730 [Opitutaceae bacterium]